MHVVVGSENPVKRRAVEQALGNRSATVEAIGVESGVSDQPWGHHETVTGAENRATEAVSRDSATLGVGLEGGVDDPEHTPGVYLIMWAAVTNGDRLERGAGPQLRLPPRVATSLQSGGELGPVLAELVDTPNLKEREGAAGVLSDGIVTRRSALRHALAGPLGAFLGGCDHIDE